MKIQKLWDKSGHVGTEIYSHTKDSRAGASFIYINNAKSFFLKKAESPYGDNVGYKTVRRHNKNC